MGKNDYIELRSKPIQDFIGKIPPKIIRTGIGAMFFTLFALLIISLFIEYPEFITLPVEIKKCSSENNNMEALLKIPPHEIFNIKTGQEIFISLDQFPISEYGYHKTTIDVIETNISINAQGEQFYQAKAAIGETLFDKNCSEITIDDLKGIAEIKQGSKSVFLKLLNY